ncbi:MAG: NAD(P)H-dependent oxidoreductase subunit E [Nitrospira sp.]|nr:NAD(P)H-dependent oxidoreductase subunit E [bacterium]MBL7047916.1 NAD(P)H-dependent oxidoreductase subunit E [Nitrospira sp.]
MTDTLKILIVDDEQIVLKSCEAILSAEGYDIETTLSGKDAILRMEKQHYDLVFTDLKMPEVDGITLIKWIKNEKPATGIVVITGYPSQDTIREALGVGIIDYVPKPFTPTVLLDVAARAVEWIKKEHPVLKEDEEFPPAMLEEIQRVIKQYKDRPGSSIPVLQRCQQIVGYLPPEIQKIIAKGLNITPAEIHSIVSFYSFFTMTPRGDHNIRICLGTACYVKRVEDVLDKIKDILQIDVGEVTEDKKFSIEAVRCLGACGLAPVIVIDEDTHGALTPKKVPAMLEQYT